MSEWIKLPEWAPEVERRTGFVHVCRLPTELGDVTKLELRGDRVIAKTESGVVFIVPTFPA